MEKYHIEKNTVQETLIIPLYGALFSLGNPDEFKSWSPDFASVTSKSYMRGYRDIYKEVSFAHRLLIRMCDGFVNMRIVKIRVREK